MLWEPESNKNDGGDQNDNDSIPVTPILVPLPDKSTAMEKNLPVLVPDVKDLKDQFQQQQNMILQLKKTIMQNESQFNSKEKQVEVYANKLSQIRARTKNTQGKKQNSSGSFLTSPKTLVKRDSKENLAQSQNPNVSKPVLSSPKLGRKFKITELKKCLEENKIKYEERTGKQQKDTKKIEIMVEQLKTQLGERDKTIQELQKVIEQPKTISKRSNRKSEFVASKYTQTFQARLPEESNEILALQKKIYDLEANVLDLEENLKEKESVIEARTQAVTLLSQDLSLKGKSTLENLEETRQEMRTMQNNFIVIENQLKKDISDKDNRLIDLEEKYAQLQSANADLGLKNTELQKKLVEIQEKYAEVEAERMLPVSANDAKLADESLKKISVLMKELDERNKAMIKLKIEHRNKLKSLNATLNSLKGSSDDKAEIFRLSTLVQELESNKNELENRVAELEDEKGNHLLSILDVDDLKATEKKLKDQINELEIIIRKQNEEISEHQTVILTLEKEKSDLTRANIDQNVLIEDLYAKLMEFGGSDEEVKEKENMKYNELRQQFENMESEYEKRLENLKMEHAKEIEMIESYYDSKTESLEKKELEEYRITTEINNIHVEEQIELLIREKQQLLEKLKALSGVSSTDSLTFEKVERLDLRADKELVSNDSENLNVTSVEENANHLSGFQKVISDQQNHIEDLQKSVQLEKEKVKLFENKISEMNETIKKLEDANATFKDQLKVAESSVECGKIQKSNFNTKNKVKKIEMELVKAKKTLDEQSKKIDDLNEKLKEKEGIIQKYTAKIELFEKDDWDRQNHWKNPEEDIENVQELQKKCLSLENSLIELNEQFEKLRKENIEVVHLLSEEKVKRKKLLEKCADEPPIGGVEGFIFQEIIQDLKEKLQNLEIKVEALETTTSTWECHQCLNHEGDWRITDLEQKLEWSNVVLTSKETEIFGLRNLLEDRNKIVEDLESDLNDYKLKFEENETCIEGLNELLKMRQKQLDEVCKNVQCLHQQRDEATRKLHDSDIKFQNLKEKFRREKDNSAKKTLEIEELQGVLSQKTADIVNLKTQLENVNNELIKNYEDRLSHLNKCLKDRDFDFEAVLSEKNNLEMTVKNLMTEQEVVYNEKKTTADENEKLRRLLAEKEESLAEANEKLKISMKNEHSKLSAENLEELKTKMKKLAANLKKKAQNESELLNQLKDMEAAVAEKDKLMETMKTNINDATEKWVLEKSEKEKIEGELQATLIQKTTLGNENSDLKEKFSVLKRDLENCQLANENRVRQLEEEIQNSTKALTEFQFKEQQYKDTITNLDKNFNDVCVHRENILSTLNIIESDLQKERLEKIEILKNIAEISDNYEKLKISHDENAHDKTKLESKLEELQKTHDALTAEKTVFEAKLQENLAFVENLESELLRTQNHVKDVEEKLFKAEERRMSLESKNEEMYRKITENSQNQIMIDDMTVRVDELLNSEKSLSCTVQNLEANNTELKRSLDESQTEIENLKKEIEGASEKVLELTDELKQMKDADAEKTSAIASLTEEVNKKAMENKQILGEYNKLNRDYEQFEVDYKESLENSQNVEKSLRHCIEELTVEKASLLEKLNLLMEEEQRRSYEIEKEAENSRQSKKKSMSLHAESEGEMNYEDLKHQFHAQSTDLKRANEEIANLKAQIFQDKIGGETSMEEAQLKTESLKFLTSEMDAVFPIESKQSVDCHEDAIQKSQTKPLTAVVQPQVEEEKKFDASMFFGSGQNVQLDQPSFFDVSVKLPVDETTEAAQGSEFDSLMWDDGWETTEHLSEEYLAKEMAGVCGTTNKNHNQHKIESLETETRKLKAEVERLTKESEDQAAKYAKALKKCKLQKVVCDKLQAELESNKYKSKENMEDLNATIMEEFKSQIELLEKREQEHLKALQNYKSEKELLLKKIEVLSAEKEKYLEMKERQNGDVEIWQTKNKELSREIAELREKLQQPLLSVDVSNESVLVQQNRELLNRVEALEWKNSELIHSVEEKEELLEKMATGLPSVELGEEGKSEKLVLQKEIEELKNVKELLEKKLTEEENKNVSTMDKLNEQLTALTSENETLQDILGEMKTKGSAMNESKIVGLKQKIEELESLCQAKDSEINRLSSYTMQVNEELSGLKQELLNLQSEKQLDSNKYEENLCQLERILKAKEDELREFRLKVEKEKEEQNRFETIDLSKSDINSVPPSHDQSEDLIKKVIELEDLLKSKTESLLMQYTLVQESNKEIDKLKLKNSELEELVQTKEFEISDLRSLSWNNENKSDTEEVNNLKKVLESKEMEIQNLNARLSNPDNFRASNERDNCDDVKPKNLENMMMSREEKFHELNFNDSSEVEELRQKVLELESLLTVKSEEINQLMIRLAELEKSYNDSKIEIERLLNEEKLNTEEKFVEPFQNNMQIPVAFELEAMVRSLDEEKQKVGNLEYALSVKEKDVEDKAEENKILTKKITDLENLLKMLSEVEGRQRVMAEESYEMKAQLEKIITDLQKELDCSNLQLEETRRELEQYQNSEDEVRSKLKAQIADLERMLLENGEKKDSEILELKSFLEEKTNFYEALLQSKREVEVEWSERAVENENLSKDLKIEIEKLVNDLASKDAEILSLTQLVAEERLRLEQMAQVLESKEGEVMDLKQTLTHMQMEIGSFRNFEKQIKELRMAQIREAGSNISATPEGNPDLSGWTEHELAELSTKLQSDLDTAMYMLHQRDVRCDELTFELMQLIEERDTLQLRLSTALRINEELRSLGNTHKGNSNWSQEVKDLVDQANDRQKEKPELTHSEDLQRLANKISELHSTSYLRDKRVKDDSVQRHAEQMTLLSRISDSDVALGRDAQNPPAVLLNWMRGKSTPKVMHI